MPGFLNKAVIVTALAAAAIFLVSYEAAGQSRPLTYPEINTALQTKLPNRAFQTKTELFRWLISQIRARKLDRPLTKDREDDLRQAGATNEIIEAIRTNSPKPPSPPVTPKIEPVDLGDILPRAIDLVRPQYSPEALKAKTMGEVVLGVELDEKGKAVSVTPVSSLPNGLTERAIDAVRSSTFRPAERDGKPARGKGVIRFNFKINMMDVPATLDAADKMRETGNCNGAVEEYTRVLGVNNQNARAFFGRGSCHLINKKYDLARNDFESTAAITKTDADVFLHLAIIKDLQGEADAADADYGKALNIKPDINTSPVFECLYLDRRPMSSERMRSHAIAVIDACSKAIPGAAPQITDLLLYKRGIAYRLREDNDRSIADLENVARTSPNMKGVSGQLQISYNARGIVYMEKKENKKAVEDITKAISLGPENPTPYINRCAVYLYGTKQYDDAIADCSMAIKLGSRSPMVFVHRGYAYEMKKDNQRAAADYSKALEIDPRNEIARTNLGRIRSAQPSLKY